MVAIAFISSNVRADGTNSVSSTPKPKPDLLKTCPVSGEKLGGDMGKPFVFVYIKVRKSNFAARIAGRNSTKIRRNT